jgi:soluble lytic murein transglycosylase
LQEPDAAAPATRDSLVAPVDIPDAAAFTLGRARAALGDHAAAIDAFRAYAEANPDMAAYVQPLIADAYLALGDTNAAVTALEAATTGAAQRFVAVANRGRLAGLLLERGDTAGAIAQYDAIRDIARTEATKGQMTYLAGLAEQQAGNTAAAQARFLTAITDYPRAAESHAALVALVEAGVPVDEYQRGVINTYAGAYQLAIDALRRAIAADPDTYTKDAHLFLAWNYEDLGDLTSALAELDAFAEHEPARALFERGEMLNRAGRADEALATYDTFVTEYPDATETAAVQWTAAQLADGAGASAAERYVALADAFPFDGNSPAALFRAAELTAAGDLDGAVALWQRLAEQYPANDNGAAALFRLLRLADSGEVDGLDAAALRQQVGTLTPSNYFALRAIDYAAGVEPFSATGDMVLPDDPADGQAAAELWLRERLVAAGVTPPEALGALSAGLAGEPGRRIGEKLWQLGLYEAAKAELETVREAYADDPVANYQLALYFQELGLFRSSIVAAASLLQQVGATVFDAPRFLGRLAYPAHYADLILPLAERYGYDPRLQFALVRQESLFESIARSTAAAQGLSQVIPDTGAWIAQRLAWPNFTNEDLFKPYVGLNFGAYYLSEQLRNFDGRVHAALAAYNAGPGNAARWAETAGSDLDPFFDTVDFTETRLYIERIYEGFNAYRHLYGAE